MKTCKSCEKSGNGLNRWTAGFGENLETLLRAHEGRARQFAYELSGNSEEAKELVQEASYRILRHWNNYDPVKSFQCWYLTILRNLFTDNRRSRARVLSLDFKVGEIAFGDGLADDEDGIHAQLENQETFASARRTFRMLKKNHRAVIALCDIEGMRCREAARRLGLPITTVRSRLFRARAALRQKAELAQIS